MSNYLTTDGLKKFSLLSEAPLRPETRGICHICHMVNPALGTPQHALCNHDMALLQEAEREYQFYRDQLWTAPELLRMKTRAVNGTQRADVYSFAIVLQEIIYRERCLEIVCVRFSTEIVISSTESRPTSSHAQTRPGVVTRDVHRKFSVNRFVN